MILSILGTIYIFFKPLDIKQKKHGEIALLELGKFKLYEFDTEGLRTLMDGSSALRYKNRYLVHDINYTDNTKEYLANLKAKKGVYRNNTVTLTDDVIYTRKDGIRFTTQKLIYNKKNGIATSNSDYVAYFNKNVMRGSYIRYNNKKDTVFSKNVQAVIEIK